jgi:hypothetical protein
MENRFKFRLWNTIEKKMVLPESEEVGKTSSDWPTTLAVGLHGLPIAFDKDSFKKNEIVGWNIDHNRIIQQWTGLKGLNGVDVYEGDIVTFGMEWGDNQVSTPQRKFYEVTWVNCGFVACQLGVNFHSDGRGFEALFNSYCEVLGHTFEDKWDEYKEKTIG